MIKDRGVFSCEVLPYVPIAGRSCAMSSEITAIPGSYSTSNRVRIAIHKSVLGLSLLILYPAGAGAQQKLSTPTCEVRLDLQYEILAGIRATLAGHIEVAPEVAQLIMNKVGEGQWDELTKHGKKYPSICLDAEHPYYVLVWNTINATESSDASAIASLHVLQNGCLVEPAVFGTTYISRSKEKATRKVFDAARGITLFGRERRAACYFSLRGCSLRPIRMAWPNQIQTHEGKCSGLGSTKTIPRC